MGPNNPRKGRATLVAAVAVALAGGCGGGGAGPRPQQAPEAPPDQVRARQLLVSSADLPSGWSRRPIQVTAEDQQVENELRACLGLTGPPARTADVRSDAFVMDQGEITSRVTVSPTTEEARRQLDTARTPQFARCLGDVSSRQFARAGAPGTTVRVDPMPVAPLADGLAAHRMTITQPVAQGVTTRNTDVFVMLVGRAQVSVNVISPAPLPPETARQVLAKVAARA